MELVEFAIEMMISSCPSFFLAIKMIALETV